MRFEKSIGEGTTEQITDLAIALGEWECLCDTSWERQAGTHMELNQAESATTPETDLESDFSFPDQLPIRSFAKMYPMWRRISAILVQPITFVGRNHCQRSPLTKVAAAVRVPVLGRL